MLELRKTGRERGKILRRVFFKTGLIHKNEIISLPVFLGGGGVGAPLFETRHLLRQIEFGTALGFHQPDHAVGGSDNERRSWKIRMQCHLIIAVESSGASGGCKAEFDGVALCVLCVEKIASGESPNTAGESKIFAAHTPRSV
jgi:hypothetical protein